MRGYFQRSGTTYYHLKDSNGSWDSGGSDWDSGLILLIVKSPENIRFQDF